ncbi:MAG: hypothetical protein GY810_23520 [Aureispira sp.]|nr:hypothetical protein [Aureispira sp.]
MLNPKQINDLEKYSNRCLSKEDKRKIEQQMQSDADYKQEAKTYLDIFGGFNGLAVDKVKSDIDGWEQKHKNQVGRVIPMRRNFMRYAAAAAIILLMVPLGYIGLQNVEPESSNDLYVAYFSPSTADIMDMTSRTGTMNPMDAIDNTDETTEETPSTATATEKTTEDDIDAEGLKLTLGKGIKAYNDKNYKDASKYFSAYVDGSTQAQTTEVKLYLGIALLAENQVDRAEPYFKDLVKNAGLKEEAEWYLALTYLRGNKIPKAKKTLSRIINQKPEHPFQEKAQALKDKIAKHNLK